jgi:hypothetical protein
MRDVTYALDDKQINFNRRLSRCRVRVENAIGYLKNRFTILKRKNHYGVAKMSDIFQCACVLHNLILLNGEPLDYGELPTDVEPRAPFVDVSMANANLFYKNLLMEHFWRYKDVFSAPPGMTFAELENMGSF